MVRIFWSLKNPEVFEPSRSKPPKIIQSFFFKKGIMILEATEADEPSLEEFFSKKISVL